MPAYGSRTRERRRSSNRRRRRRQIARAHWARRGCGCAAGARNRRGATGGNGRAHRELIDGVDLGRKKRKSEREFVDFSTSFCFFSREGSERVAFRSLATSTSTSKLTTSTPRKPRTNLSPPRPTLANVFEKDKICRVNFLTRDKKKKQK